MRGLAAAIVAAGIGTFAGCAQIGPPPEQEEPAGDLDAGPADDPGGGPETLELECEGICLCPKGARCDFDCEPLSGLCLLRCPSGRCSMLCPAKAACVAECGPSETTCAASDSERPTQASCTPGGCTTQSAPP